MAEQFESDLFHAALDALIKERQDRGEPLPDLADLYVLREEVKKAEADWLADREDEDGD